MEAKFMGRLNAEEREGILALAGQGKTVAEISREMLRPRSTIVSVLKRSNGHSNGVNGVDDLAAVRERLDDQWARLSLERKLDLLLRQ
jgi:IS30 family transposase